MAHFPNDEKFPQFASSWHNSKHLEMLEVFFAPYSFKDPNHILDNLNKTMTHRKKIPALPVQMECLKEFINEYVHFDIVDDEISLLTNREITRIYISTVDECRNRLSSLDISEYMQTKNIHEQELELKRLMTRVYVKTLDFLDMMIKFLKMLLLPTKPYKSAYTELIRVFCSICDFTSVPGDAFQRLVNLQGQPVVCEPDVRFFLETPTSKLEDLLVLTIGEINRDRRWIRAEEKGFNIVKEVDDKILGHHGGELVLESPYSFFKPCALGAICLGTEIIFTFLDIDMEHFDKLTSNEKMTLKDSAYIHYTEPYNIMVSEDRGMLLELLLRLSLFQRRNQ